jgi:hypothetical protein
MRSHLSLVVGQPLGGNGSYKLRLRSTAYSTPAKTRMIGSSEVSIIKMGRSNIDELEKSSIGALVRICAFIAW